MRSLDTPARSGTLVRMVTVVVVLSTVLAGVAGTGLAGAADTSPTSVSDGGTDRIGSGTSANTADSTTSAISASVRLTPSTAEVNEGQGTTYEVVVDEASGGVGTIDGRIQLETPEAARITAFEFRNDPGLQNVSISDDRSSVDFRAALLDTADSGPVTVATVTLRGTSEGSTDVSLRVNTLGNESGTPYDIGATPDAQLSVANTKDSVNLEVTADQRSAEPGSSVEFTTRRIDSDARVAATLHVGDRRYETGVDGRATIELTESMANDAGSVTVVASKAGTDDETFVNDSVSVDLTQTGNEGDEDSGNDGGTEGGGGTVVRLESPSADANIGEPTELDIVVSGVSDGVGAVEMTVSVDAPDIAEITTVEMNGSPGIEDVTVADDGSSVEIRAAIMDTENTDPVTIGTLTIEGRSAGEVTIDPSVTELGDEAGNDYPVGSTPDSTVSVRGDKSKADGSGDASDRFRTAIIAIDGFPDGFQRASITISATGGVEITSIEPLLVKGNQFRIAEGGTGTSSATVQAVDLSGSVGSFEDSKELFRVTFDGDVSGDEVSIRTNTLVNDAGEEVSTDRVSIRTSTRPSFSSPLPGAQTGSPPSDLDGDGLYEDVDGDDDKDFDDAIALAFVDTGALSESQAEALDFDGDGDVDMDDAIELAFL